MRSTGHQGRRLVEAVPAKWTCPFFNFMLSCSMLFSLWKCGTMFAAYQARMRDEPDAAERCYAIETVCLAVGFLVSPRRS